MNHWQQKFIECKDTYDKLLYEHELLKTKYAQKLEDQDKSASVWKQKYLVLKNEYDDLEEKIRKELEEDIRKEVIEERQTVYDKWMEEQEVKYDILEEEYMALQTRNTELLKELKRRS